MPEVLIVSFDNARDPKVMQIPSVIELYGHFDSPKDKKYRDLVDK